MLSGMTIHRFQKREIENKCGTTQQKTKVRRDWENGKYIVNSLSEHVPEDQDPINRMPPRGNRLKLVR
jgi:hypothetical protein